MTNHVYQRAAIPERAEWLLMGWMCGYPRLRMCFDCKELNDRWFMPGIDSKRVTCKLRALWVTLFPDRPGCQVTETDIPVLTSHIQRSRGLSPRPSPTMPNRAVQETPIGAIDKSHRKHTFTLADRCGLRVRWLACSKDSKQQSPQIGALV